MEPLVDNIHPDTVSTPTTTIEHERNHQGRYYRLPPTSPPTSRKTTEAFISSTRELTIAHTQSSTTLQAALDCSYMLSHAKKDTFSQHTNLAISLSGPVAYAMLAILADPDKISLLTNTTTRGQIRQQIATTNFTTHTSSILGRTYWQILTDPDIIQLSANTPPLHYNLTKGLTCRPSDTMVWATTMLAHDDVLHAYKEGLQELDHEERKIEIPYMKGL